MEKHKIFILSTLILFISLPGCSRQEKNTADAGRHQVHQDNNSSVQKIIECRGYILNAVELNGKSFIIIDTVQWSADDQSENGLSIRNLKQDSIRTDLTDETEVIMQTYSRDPRTGQYNFNQKITSAQFKQYVKKNPGALQITPFSFIIDQNKVQAIKEIYIP